MGLDTDDKELSLQISVHADSIQHIARQLLGRNLTERELKAVLPRMFRRAMSDIAGDILYVSGSCEVCLKATTCLEIKVDQKTGCPFIPKGVRLATSFLIS